jgi:hypothetical protein
VGAKSIELAALLDRYGVSGAERADLVEFARQSQRRRPGAMTGSRFPAPGRGNRA